jgi:hypothetical protein
LEKGRASNVEHAEVETSLSGAAAGGDPDVTMEVLKNHVPLTLLMDLGSVDGPDSESISAIEGGDAGWLTGAAPRPAGDAVV